MRRTQCRPDQATSRLVPFRPVRGRRSAADHELPKRRMRVFRAAAIGTSPCRSVRAVRVVSPRERKCRPRRSRLGHGGLRVAARRELPTRRDPRRLAVGGPAQIAGGDQSQTLPSGALRSARLPMPLPSHTRGRADAVCVVQGPATRSRSHERFRIGRSGQLGTDDGRHIEGRPASTPLFGDLPRHASDVAHRPRVHYATKPCSCRADSRSDQPPRCASRHRPGRGPDTGRKARTFRSRHAQPQRFSLRDFGSGEDRDLTGVERTYACSHCD